MAPRLAGGVAAALAFAYIMRRRSPVRWQAMNIVDPRDADLPIHAQIANLEFKLAFLYEKRQTFLKNGRLLKRGMWVMLVVAAVLVPCLAISTQQDPVPALFIATVLIGTIAAVLWTYRNETWEVDASNQLPGYSRYTSYVAFVEESIKEHEKRLAELKAKS